MDEPAQLNRHFFARHAIDVAKELLGKRLVRIENGQRISGLIIETEAYHGEDDLGCHARAGFTNRTKVMYGEAGIAYIYFTYGMHWMLNFVCDRVGFPAAVLIRAVKVSEGSQIVLSRRRNQPIFRWTDGPAKLCRAFNIDGSMNGYDICQSNGSLFVEKVSINVMEDFSILEKPRVGLKNVPEPWKSIPWRFITDFER